MAVAAEVHIFAVGLHFGFAVCVDREIRVIAGMMAFRIVEAMLLAIRIEVRSGGFEVGRGATRVLMKVDGMFARGKIFEIEFHSHSSRFFLPQHDGADAFPLRVLQVNDSFSEARGSERQ
jgi:hypothetical protein